MNKQRTFTEIMMRFSRGYRHYFLIALVCVFVTTGLDTLTPQIVRFTVDSVLGNDTPELIGVLNNLFANVGGQEFFRKHLLVIGVIMLIIALFSGISNYIFRTNIAKGSQGFTKSLRDYLYRHIQSLPYSWHTSHQTGDIIQRVTGDMDVIQNFITTHLIETIRILLLVSVVIGIMISMNWQLALVSLAFVPVISGYTKIFYSRIRKQFRRTDEAEGELVTVIQENLTGVRVVRAFGRESFEMDKFDEKNTTYTNIWISLGYTMGAYWGFGSFFTCLQTMCVLVVGTIFVVEGNLSVGELITFFSYSTMINNPLRRLGRIFSEMSKLGVSLDRIGEILFVEEEKSKEEALTPPVAGEIAFNHVEFSYKGTTQQVLKDVSLTVKAGTTLGILGGTGSGKSTLVHLLNRLYDPTEGKITIDGMDIRDMDLDYLRSHIGMVLQEPFLFSKTIKDNIAITGTLTEEELFAVSNTASIHSSIEGFEKGYNTIVGERGVTLSGGQKQRVAIARMLAQNTPIMIFDDSLSALDSETDFAIRNALRNRPTTATTIIISHRINSIMHADQIVVLDEGRISESGTHEELIHSGGIYNQIYDIQFNTADRLLEGEEQ